MSDKFLTTAQVKELTDREFLLLVGHPGSGKSYGILTLARYWQLIHPENRIWILDTEKGIDKLLRNQFSDIENVRLRPVGDAEDAIVALREAASLLARDGNDILCFESLSRNWEQSQDLASQVVTGMPRSEYLSKWVKETKGKGSPVPHPDMFWPVAKDAHVRNLLDVMSNQLKGKCHIICTTTLPPDRSPIRERGAVRMEIARYLGIDVSPDGAPRNSYYFDSVILLEKDRDGYWGRVLKDRGYSSPASRFKVETLYLNLLVSRK